MAWDKYAHEVKPKPGAVDFLRAIRKKGLRVGIASSNSRDLILACLEGNQIADCFDCIVTSCDVAKGKPAPDVYLKAAELLGAEPETCLVFEDVPMGILSGKKCRHACLRGGGCLFRRSDGKDPGTCGRVYCFV